MAAAERFRRLLPARRAPDPPELVRPWVVDRRRKCRAPRNLLLALQQSV